MNCKCTDNVRCTYHSHFCVICKEFVNSSDPDAVGPSMPTDNWCHVACLAEWAELLANDESVTYHHG